MARVPILDPSQVVEPTDRPGSARANDYFHLDVPRATPADFGAQIGAATERSGQGLEDVGAALAQRANASQQIVNETAARDASTKAINAMSGAMSDYLQKRGQNAVDGFQPFNDTVDKIAQDASDSVGNPVARNMLQEQLARMRTYMVEGAARHRATEQNAWAVQSHQEQAQTFADQAMSFRNNPGRVDEFINNGAGEIGGMAQIYGWDANTTQQKMQEYRGKAYRQVIESLALDNPLAAQTMFDRTRNLMDAESQVRVGEFLHAKVDKAGDDAFLSGIIHNGAVVPGSADVDQLFNGVMWHESRGQQTKPDGSPLISVKLADDPDAPVGVSQIRPSTAQDVAKSIGVVWDPERLRTDRAYNATLGKAFLNSLIGHYGNPTLALAAYDAGSRNVNKWLQQNGDPRTGQISFQDWINKIPFAETREYVQSVGGSVVGSLGYQPPNQVPLTRDQVPLTRDQVPLTRDQAMQRAQQSSNDPEVQLRRMSKVNEYYMLLEHGDAQFRADVERKVADLGPAALAGESIVIPDADIRRAYVNDPARAEQTIANLKLDAFAGQLFSQMKYATPEERAQIGRDLVSGTGAFKDVLKGKGGQLLGGVFVPNGDETQSDADFRTRNLVLQRFMGLQQAQQEALDPHKGDPATYVMGMPGIKAAYDAAHSQNGTQQDWQRYAQAVTTAQTHLGVAPDDVRILPRQEAVALAAKFATGDPAETDHAPQMQALASGFGDYWPQVYKQMVQQGHLPQEAQSIAWMDAPGQDAARNDFTRAMQFAGKEGVKKLREAAPAEAVQDIRKNIDQALDPVRATILSPGRSGAAADAFNNLRDAVEMVALYRAMQGGSTVSGASALTSAVNDVINAKWDLAPTYRTPKGSLAQAEQTASAIQNAIKPEDIKREAGDADLTDAQWRTVVANGPMAWVNNKDGTGLYLVQQRRDGGWAPIHVYDTASIANDNLQAAKAAMNLTPQEENIYQHHLANLRGTGKVFNQDGSVSSVLQAVVEHDGKYYNIPTVWDGKELGTGEAVKRAAALGWDHWPAYATADQADARYMQMHNFMDKDTSNFLGSSKRVEFKFSDMAKLQSQIGAANVPAAPAYTPGG